LCGKICAVVDGFAEKKMKPICQRSKWAVITIAVVATSFSGPAFSQEAKSTAASSAAKKTALTTQPTPAQSKSEMEPKDYPDSRGKSVHFPEGDLSFADEIVRFDPGEPGAAPAYMDPKNMLGPPDYRYGAQESRPVALTLGCGGEVVFRFTNNALVDVKGPDLYIFEVGEDEEPCELSISEDGRKWIDIGKTSGATSAVDIGPFVAPGEIFHYVRLRDLRAHCEGEYPGADIDAVGAIGSALKLSMQSSVVFDYKDSTVKSGARNELHQIAQILKQHPNAKLIIEGHTDSVGGDEYNQKLSEARAEAVKDILVSDEKLANLKIETKGYGKSRPLASNTSEEGREKNRRVEIIVLPN
jgi:OmpA-OmpF porin, OOP family